MNRVSLDVFTAADLKDACFILVRFPDKPIPSNVDEMMEALLQVLPPDGRMIYLIPVYGDMTLEMLSEEMMEQAGWQRRKDEPTLPT